MNGLRKNSVRKIATAVLGTVLAATLAQAVAPGTAHAGKTSGSVGRSWM